MSLSAKNQSSGSRGSGKRALVVALFLIALVAAAAPSATQQWPECERCDSQGQCRPLQPNSLATSTVPCTDGLNCIPDPFGGYFCMPDCGGDPCYLV